MKKEEEEKERKFQNELNFCIDRPKIWFETALNFKLTATELYNLKLSRMYDFFHKKDGMKNRQFYESSNIERMLWGYSIENLLKGIYVSTNFISVKENKNLLNKIFTHNLVYLAKKLDLSITDIEKRDLEFLRKCVVWAGKYPIPKSTNDVLLKERENIPIFINDTENNANNFDFLSSEFDKYHTILSTREFQRYNELFSKIEKIFNELNQ